MSHEAVREQIYAAIRLALRHNPPMSVQEIQCEVEYTIHVESKRQEERKLENLREKRTQKRIMLGLCLKCGAQPSGCRCER